MVRPWKNAGIGASVCGGEATITLRTQREKPATEPGANEQLPQSGHSVISNEAGPSNGAPHTGQSHVLPRDIGPRTRNVMSSSSPARNHPSV